MLLLTAPVSPDCSAVRAAMSAGLDWDRLRALVEHERAAAVVLRYVRRVDTNGAPVDDHDLRSRATTSVVQMMQLEQHLHRTVAALADLGIDVMLLKGAGLAYTAFDSFADRPMGDLDVLVREHQAEHAWTALQSQGWTWPAEVWEVGRYVGHQHRPPLIREPGGFRLEIHDDLLGEGHPFRFSADVLWERARRVPVRGRVFIVPDPMHQLWHTCVHFAWSHHLQWGAWRAVRDCAAIIARGGIDWTEFVEFARESRAGTCCYWTLRLARRLAGADVPDRVLAALRPPRGEKSLTFLERHYVANLFPSEAGCPSMWLTFRLWEAGIMPRWSGHGAARPWHVSERWSEGGEQAEPKLRRAFSPQLRTLGASLTYLRGIPRLVLPVGTHQPEHQDRIHGHI